MGPFDLGFIECGQYNEMWHQIHMYPEEGVVAALEAGASKVMPVHWGSFALAMHHWKEASGSVCERSFEMQSSNDIASSGHTCFIAL